MSQNDTEQHWIVGGGVIGLALAWELARRGRTVRVLRSHREVESASWAGAGILPPAPRDRSPDPYDALHALSEARYPAWCEALTAETGLPTGFRRSGGLYLARTRGEQVALIAWAEECRDRGLSVEPVSVEDLPDWEPQLRRPAATSGASVSVSRGAASVAVALPVSKGGEPRGAAKPSVSVQPPGGCNRSPWLAAFILPDECQVRNPQLLQALDAACRKAGVTIESGVTVQNLITSNDRTPREGRLPQPQGSDTLEPSIVGVTVATVDSQGRTGTLRSLSPNATVTVAGGAWTADLLAPLGVRVPIVPIRGQMLLYDRPDLAITRILNVGTRYLVPRGDGKILVGSTEEEVGFDRTPTSEGIAELRAFAESLVPALANSEPVRTWTGFRPATLDGWPYLSDVPPWRNLTIASGHFRAGLTLAPATAVVMADLLLGRTPSVPLEKFHLLRR